MPRARRSRRTRNEPPEIVPKKQATEKDDDEDDDDKKEAPASDAKVEKKSTRRSMRSRKPTTRSVQSSTSSRGKRRQVAASSDDQKSKDDEDSGSSDNETDQDDSKKTNENEKGGKDEESSSPEHEDGSATLNNATKSPKKSLLRKSRRRLANDKDKEGEDQSSSSEDEDGSDSKASASAKKPQLRKSRRRLANEKEKGVEDQSSSSSEDDDGSVSEAPKNLKMPKLRKSQRRQKKQEEKDADGQSSSSEHEDGSASKEPKSTKRPQQSDQTVRKSRSTKTKATETKAPEKEDANEVDKELGDGDGQNDVVSRDEQKAIGTPLKRKSNRRTDKSNEAKEDDVDNEEEQNWDDQNDVESKNVKQSNDSEADKVSVIPKKGPQKQNVPKQTAPPLRKSRRRAAKVDAANEEGRQPGDLKNRKTEGTGNEHESTVSEDGDESAAPSKPSRNTKRSQKAAVNSDGDDSATPSRASRSTIGSRKAAVDSDPDPDGDESATANRASRKSKGTKDVDDGKESDSHSKESKSTKGSGKPAAEPRRSRRRAGKKMEEIKEEEEEENKDQQSSGDDEMGEANDFREKTSAKKIGKEQKDTKTDKKDRSSARRQNRKRPRAEEAPMPRADAIKAETLSDENLSSEGENESDGESRPKSVASAAAKGEGDADSCASEDKKGGTKGKISDDATEEIGEAGIAEADKNLARDTINSNDIGPNQDSDKDGNQVEAISAIFEQPNTGMKGKAEQGGSAQKGGRASLTPGQVNGGEADGTAVSTREDGNDRTPDSKREASSSDVPTSTGSRLEEKVEAVDARVSSPEIQEESCKTENVAMLEGRKESRRDSSEDLHPTSTTNHCNVVDDTDRDDVDQPPQQETTQRESSSHKMALPDEVDKKHLESHSKEPQNYSDPNLTKQQDALPDERSADDGTASKSSGGDSVSGIGTPPGGARKISVANNDNIDEREESQPATHQNTEEAGEEMKDSILGAEEAQSQEITNSVEDAKKDVGDDKTDDVEDSRHEIPAFVGAGQSSKAKPPDDEKVKISSESPEEGDSQEVTQGMEVAKRNLPSYKNADAAEESRPAKRLRGESNDEADSNDDSEMKGSNGSPAGRPAAEEGEKKGIEKAEESRPVKRSRSGNEDGDEQTESYAKTSKDANSCGEIMLEENMIEKLQGDEDADEAEQSRPGKRFRTATDGSDAANISEVQDMSCTESSGTAKNNSVEVDDSAHTDISESGKASRGAISHQEEPSVDETLDKEVATVDKESQQMEVKPDESGAIERPREKDGDSTVISIVKGLEDKAPTKPTQETGKSQPSDGSEKATPVTDEKSLGADYTKPDSRPQKSLNTGIIMATSSSCKEDDAESKHIQTTNEIVNDSHMIDSSTKTMAYTKDSEPKKQTAFGVQDQQLASMEVVAAGVPDNNIGTENLELDKPEAAPVEVKKADIQTQPKSTLLSEIEELTSTSAKDTTAADATEEAPAESVAIVKPDVTKDAQQLETEKSSQDAKETKSAVNENEIEFVDASDEQSPHNDEQTSELVSSVPSLRADGGMSAETDKRETSSLQADSKSDKREAQPTSNKDPLDSDALKQDVLVQKGTPTASNAIVGESDDDNELFHDAHMELPEESTSLGSPKGAVVDDGETGQEAENGVISPLPDTSEVGSVSKPFKDDQEIVIEKPEDALAVSTNRLINKGTEELQRVSQGGQRAHDIDPICDEGRTISSTTKLEATKDPPLDSLSSVALPVTSGERPTEEKVEPIKAASKESYDKSDNEVSLSILPKDSTLKMVLSSCFLPTAKSFCKHQYEYNQLNRVKTLLYSTGSRVHRGRGFERIFAEYWDAIMLRLSDRLSSHTSECCEKPIRAFLRSSRLRKLHNRFIRSIMKRATSRVVPYHEVANHIPRKWASRIPVLVKSERERVAQSPSVEMKSLVSQGQGSCFNEAWPREAVTDVATPERPVLVANPPGRRERESSCIPAALIVDPMARAAVRERSMHVSENAVWLLTVAVKEYTSSLLKHSISHRLNQERGSVPKPGSCCDNTLANHSLAAKKGSSSKTGGIDDDVGGGKGTPQQESRGSCLGPLDILTGSMQLGGSSTSNLGGSASRFALERCFQSSFVSTEPSPENDFAGVQRYFVEQISAFARRRLTESQKKSENKTESSTEQKNPGQVERERKLHSEFAPADPNGNTKGDPVRPEQFNEVNPKVPQRKNNALETSMSNNMGQPVKGAESVVGASAHVSQCKELPSTSTDSNEAKDGGPKGLGRSAKNLAALLKRAGTTKEDDSGGEKASEEVKGGEKDVSNPDPGNTSPGNATQQTGVAGAESHAPKDTVQPSQPANPKPEKEDNEESQPVRRGKGFGTKNLAAMRARATKKPDE